MDSEKELGQVKVVDATENILVEVADSDELELAAMGKKQVLWRGFGFWSLLGVAVSITITWEGILTVFLYGLTDGGPSGLIYGYIFSWIGYLAMVSSVGELVSMAPTAGAHYHWAYMLAPDWCRVFVSYFTGWSQVIFWQATMLSGSFLTATILQGVIILDYPDYDAQRWQATLLMYAVVAFAVIVNLFLLKLIPIGENINMVFHVALWFGVIVPLVYFSPHANASDVFANFIKGGGYESGGVTFFVGLLTSVYASQGADGIVHMVEEIPSPARTVPWVLITCIAINGALGFGMLIAFLFCLGDVDAALQSPTGYPFIEILRAGLNSTAGATAITSLLLAIFMTTMTSALAACSRMLWAFARDGAVPFAAQLGSVHTRLRVPVYSILLTATVTVLLGLINIGSSTALNAFVSLSVAGSLGCYIVVVGLVLWRRVARPHTLHWGPWHLGRWGGAVVNCVALVYVSVAVLFSFFPTSVPVVPSTMNWSCLMYGATVIFAVLFYVFDGRKRYRGPIVEIQVVGGQGK